MNIYGDTGKEIIHSGWKAAGITDALNNGRDGIESFDLFHDIDLMMENYKNTTLCGSFLTLQGTMTMNPIGEQRGMATNLRKTYLMDLMI